jgi:YspA, cpYpsA-related SLOG family
MRILVTGDRNWRRMDVIERELKKFPPDTVVIHGAARGADTLGGFVADKLGFKVISFPAKWSIYGKGAGPIRNQVMIDEGKPELVLAFHENLSESKGTKDMVNRARGVGIKVEVFKG